LFFAELQKSGFLSMFNGSTVIILGAGASVDFGLPLGSEIFHLIIEDCDQLLDAVKSEGAEFIGALDSSRHYIMHPLGHLTYHQVLHELGGSKISRRDCREPAIEAKLGAIEDLRQALMLSTAETIDEFVTLNPSNAELCLRIMASVMFRRLYEFKDGAYVRKNFLSRMTTSGERNWIHLFINAFRTNYIRGQIPKDRIRIVSFNYDPILRVALDELFGAIERPVGNWQDVFDLHQVYGAFQPAPSSVDNVYELIAKWSDGITTVGLERSGFPSGVIPHIASAVRNADFIYAAGFAFARENCALIGLSERDLNRPIHFVNFDNNPGLHDRVSTYGRSNVVKSYADSGAGKMTMSRAIQLGVFGELPA
jgi:hypothetical protein